jgi:hypothetical protein
MSKPASSWVRRSYVHECSYETCFLKTEILPYLYSELIVIKDIHISLGTYWMCQTPALAGRGLRPVDERRVFWPLVMSKVAAGSNLPRQLN